MIRSPVRRTTGLLLACCAAAAAFPQAVLQGDGTLPPEVELQRERYSEARDAFRTRLLRAGPAPAAASMPEVPDGVSAVEFPSGELRLRAWLARPDEGSTKGPAVLFLHGGFALGVEDWEMTAPLRAAGYVVMVPMLRGENGQAGHFTLFYDEVEDVLAAGRFLAEQLGVDAEHVYVAGHSVGGTLALLAAQCSQSFAAAASLSGSPDQVLYCRFGIAKEQIPFDVSDPRELEMRSPLAYATSFRCPARLFFGTEEPHFRLSSEKTAEVARAAGLDVQALPSTGDHFSAVPATLEQCLIFFEEH